MQRGIVTLTIAMSLLAFVGCRNDNYYLLEYPTAQFRGGREKVYGFSSGGLKDKYRANDYTIIDMYLKLSDGSIIKLGDLSEEMVREWVAKKSEALRDKSVLELTDQKGMKANMYDIDGYNCLFFRDGKLVECHISGPLSVGPLSSVQIGRTADGEFLSFPISREDLLRTFGEPTEIRKVAHRPPN
jgi:hypothetical protein